MTFEEVYKILYEKYEIVSFDYVDKRIKVKDSTTIITYDLFELIEGLRETYAPKIKMTKNEYEMFKCLKRAPRIGIGIVDYSKREPRILFSNESHFVEAWLNPELIEVSDE